MRLMSEFKPAEKIRSVSVKEQQVFDTGKTVYTVHVTRNTVTIDNLIDSVCQRRPEYKHYQLKQFAADLQEEILASLAAGNAVDLIDLGVLYIAALSALKNRPADEGDIGELTVRFTPSDMVCRAVKNITIDKVVNIDSSPVISAVAGLGTQEEETLEAGKVARLSGSRLKLGGAGSFVAFVPLDETGTPVSDESAWLKVDGGFVIRNLPKTLEFYVPGTVSPDKSYRIAVRTNYSAGKTERKSYATSLSRIVQVK